MVRTNELVAPPGPFCHPRRVVATDVEKGTECVILEGREEGRKVTGYGRKRVGEGR
jgi:hypothetical protein